MTTDGRAAGRPVEPHAVAARPAGIGRRLGIAGEAVARTLFDGEPRITLIAARGGRQPSQTGVSVTPYMMAPGDEKIIADRLSAVLSQAAGADRPRRRRRRRPT